MAALGGRLRDEPLGQRVEEGEAEGLVRFDLLCVAPIDGDERRAARASRPWRQCEQREREEAGEGAGGCRSSGGLLILDQARGEQPRRREQVSGAARHGASAIPGATVKEKRGFCENPLVLFPRFQIFKTNRVSAI